MTTSNDAAQPGAGTGGLGFDLEAGAVRCAAFGGEVLRMIDYPIRDADWRTLAIEEISAKRRGDRGLRRRFRAGAFAAAWAVAATAAAARGYLDLGAAEVEVAGGPAAGLISIQGRGRRWVRGIVANLGPQAAEVAAPAGAGVLALDAASVCDADWLDGPGALGSVRLAPFDFAPFKESGA